MPNLQFDEIIPPDDFLHFAIEWIAGGVQVVGGCCGLSPEHIAKNCPAQAADRGSDLVVMGRYGHSCVRGFVLGGKTKTMLCVMTVPVAIAH